MLNQQPTETRDWHESGSVDFHSAWETIQGEGPLVGTPSVFVRLAGCNLQCPACDTDYTSQRRILSPSEVVIVVTGIRLSGLVVLTGGEPFRQNIIPLIIELIEAGYQVQVETNGILFSIKSPWYSIDTEQLTIVCSPKTSKVHPDLIPYIDAWKYIVRYNEVNKHDGLPLQSLGYDYLPARPPSKFPKNKIFVQPMDEVDPDTKEYQDLNVTVAVNSCLEFGYRLSLQTHKMLDLA